MTCRALEAARIATASLSNRPKHVAPEPGHAGDTAAARRAQLIQHIGDDGLNFQRRRFEIVAAARDGIEPPFGMTPTTPAIAARLSRRRQSPGLNPIAVKRLGHRQCRLDKHARQARHGYGTIRSPTPAIAQPRDTRHRNVGLGRARGFFDQPRRHRMPSRSPRRRDAAPPPHPRTAADARRRRQMLVEREAVEPQTRHPLQAAPPSAPDCRRDRRTGGARLVTSSASSSPTANVSVSAQSAKATRLSSS